MDTFVLAADISLPHRPAGQHCWTIVDLLFRDLLLIHARDRLRLAGMFSLPKTRPPYSSRRGRCMPGVLQQIQQNGS